MDVAAEAAVHSAELELQAARVTAATAEALVLTRVASLDAAREALLHAQSDQALPLGRKSLLKAYALWLLVPLAWPGAYLFYLGRDAHCLVHTCTFGGFGLGWLLDGLCMPLYVADHNEPAGHLERAERRLRSWRTPLTLALPATWLVQLAAACLFGAVGANLVPRPLPPLPAALAELLGVPPLPPSAGATLQLSLCAGLLCAALALQTLAATVGGRARCRVKTRCVLGWAAAGAALLLGSRESLDPADESVMPQLMLGAAGAAVGAARGRVFVPRASPRRAIHRRRLSARLALQLVGTAAFAACGAGAFYLNGSYTATDFETGARTTYAGPEALLLAWEGLSSFSSTLSESLGTFYEIYRRRSWAEIGAEIAEAFRNPAVEAAELLGVAPDAPADVIKRAHRQLARTHHPDKVGDDPALQEEAKVYMQRLNWAKEVLLPKVESDAAPAW